MEMLGCAPNSAITAAQSPFGGHGADWSPFPGLTITVTGSARAAIATSEYIPATADEVAAGMRYGAGEQTTLRRCNQGRNVGRGQSTRFKVTDAVSEADMQEGWVPDERVSRARLPILR